MKPELITGAVALVDAMARVEPGKVFIHGEAGELSYGVAIERIAKLTGIFSRLGLAPGARVAYLRADGPIRTTRFAPLPAARSANAWMRV